MVIALPEIKVRKIVDMMAVDAIIYISFAFFLGGLLKGATGVGAPFVAVPVMAMLFDAQFAVACFVMPNIVTNIVQFFQTRTRVASWRLLWKFGLAGASGAVAGSFVLVSVSQQWLMLTISALMLAFVGWRIAKPQLKLSLSAGIAGAVPAGFIAGMLQGAAGISAPVSVSYLSLLKLERSAFIATISFFFLAMGLVQLPALIQLGVITPELFYFSCFAILPLLGGMPAGAFLARFASAEQFNLLLLIILTALAFRLAISAVF